MTPDEKRTYMRRWRHDHPEYNMKYRIAHREHYQRYQQAYYYQVTKPKREQARLIVAQQLGEKHADTMAV